MIGSKARRYINVGCGTTFINSPEWLNLDLNSTNEGVENSLLRDLIRRGLSGQFDGIYCSHLIEHFDRNEFCSFLDQCNQLLRSGGGLRIVTPDFDSIVAKYFEALAAGNLSRASFEKILLLEQCIRTVPSGSYRKDIAKIMDSDDSLDDYIVNRTGESALGRSNNARVLHRSKDRRWHAILRRAHLRLIKKWRRRSAQLLRLLAPTSLKGNVSTTDAGERHLWIYSFFELKEFGKEHHYRDVTQVDGSRSNIFSCLDIEQLDLLPGGEPRKGEHSMYVEMFKADIHI